VLDADAEVDRRDFTVRARLTVAPGERLALFGPSGAGKTTLLEMIAGLVQPRRGRITLGGRVLTSTARPRVAVPAWQRRVGLLRQDPALFPHLSVRDNLSYARHGQGARRRPGRADRVAARPGGAAEREEMTPLTELAEVLGIDGLLPAMPSRLSGGQAHRVALGRLLLAPCEALLLDEPYTGLDASLRKALTDLVVRLGTQRRIPAILVAHELAQAQAFAQRLAVLDRGEILQAAAPDEVVRRPATRRVAELVGYPAFIGVQPALAECVTAGSRPAAAAGSPATVGHPLMVAAGAPSAVAAIHPDRIIGGSHPARGLVLTGVVASCLPYGALWETTITTAAGPVTGRLPEPAPTGRQLTVTAIDPPCFGPDGTALRLAAR
jgi:molybdate transport system ATP-binding protein